MRIFNRLFNLRTSENKPVWPFLYEVFFNPLFGSFEFKPAKLTTTEHIQELSQDPNFLCFASYHDLEGLISQISDNVFQPIVQPHKR